MTKTMPQSVFLRHCYDDFQEFLLVETEAKTLSCEVLAVACVEEQETVALEEEAAVEALGDS